MAMLRQLNITLPEETLRMIESKVASGEYKDPSDVVLEGLSHLEEHDKELEHWLRTEIVARCESMTADPSRGLTLEEVRADLSDDEAFEEFRKAG
jgi:antitoxin ParD1/3/4